MSVAFPRPLARRSARGVLDGAGGARAMTWVMAIMLFLTLLAAAAGLSVRDARRAMARQLAGRMTVELAPEQQARVLAVLRAAPGVARTRAVPAGEVAALLRPWLGSDAADAGLPVPALIDLDLADEAPATAARVAGCVRAAAPGARIDRHESWMTPVARLMDTAVALAAVLVVLMAAAVAAVAVLAARAALETHRATIEVMHMLGATDGQVSRLFGRRIALDAGTGGAAGTAAAAAVAALVGREVGALGSDLLGGASLARADWAVLAAIPFGFVVLAVAAARLAVSAALRRMP